MDKELSTVEIKMINEHWCSYSVQRGFEEVRPFYHAIDGHGWIAGSYAAFMASIQPEPVAPGDIDIFARSADDAKKIVDGIQRIRKRQGPGRGWFDIDENETAITIHRHKPELSIQVVKPAPTWNNFPWDILENFDLDISRAVLVAPNKVIGDYNVGTRTAKILRVNNPLRSLKRVLKYHDRGVEFNDHELLKLFRAWEQMPEDRRKEMVEKAHEEAFPVDIVDSGFWLDDDSFDGE